MKTLLTGADGYIGSMAGAHLKDAGHDVVGLSPGERVTALNAEPGQLFDRVSKPEGAFR
jgi:nucleoside-diphosphate-sugar epimerase